MKNVRWYGEKLRVPKAVSRDLISLIILSSTWQSAAFLYIYAVHKAAKPQKKSLTFKSPLLIPTVSTNAFHSTNLFLFFSSQWPISIIISDEKTIITFFYSRTEAASQFLWKRTPFILYSFFLFFFLLKFPWIQHSLTDVAVVGYCKFFVFQHRTVALPFF